MSSTRGAGMDRSDREIKAVFLGCFIVPFLFRMAWALAWVCIE
jgi:hypothetical protein